MTNLSSLRMRHGVAVAIVHAVETEADTRVVVFGDPQNASYDWGIERKGKIEQHSDCAYGTPYAALRDGLIAYWPPDPVSETGTPMWAITFDGRIQAAYDRKTMAEAYASGFSHPEATKVIEGTWRPK